MLPTILHPLLQYRLGIKITLGSHLVETGDLAGYSTASYQA